MHRSFGAFSREREWAGAPFIWIAGSAIFALPLLVYAAVGSFMRYSGDDYCYGAILEQAGFWKAQWESYFHVSIYNGNRYSLTLLSGLSGLLGPRMSGVLPGLAILLWVMGMAFALYQAAITSGNPLKRWQALLLALALVFLTLYLAPDLPQSLYWRSGMLPYLAPLVVNAYLVGIIFKTSRRAILKPLTVGLVVLLAFFSGGFSETGGALQAGLLVLFLLWAVAALRIRQPSARRRVFVVMAALAGTGIAILVLFISPANLPRLADLPPPPALREFLGSSFRNGWIFVHSSLRWHILPSLLAIFLFFFLSLLHYQPVREPGSLQAWWLPVWMFAVLVGAYLLIVTCMVPSAYAQSDYPEGRALITARFVMVSALAATGWLAGLGASLLGTGKWLVKSPASLGLLIAFGFIFLLPLTAAQAGYAEIPRYQKWAAFWDARDGVIRFSKQQGVQDIEVVEIDHIIPRVGELQADPGYWYNKCAAMYYGVGSIRAGLPGWDD